MIHHKISYTEFFKIFFCNISKYFYTNFEIYMYECICVCIHFIFDARNQEIIDGR